MARHDLAADADPDGDGPRQAVGSPSFDERRRRIARLVVREHRRRLIERGRLVEQALRAREDEDAREGESAREDETDGRS